MLFSNVVVFGVIFFLIFTSSSILNENQHQKVILISFDHLTSDFIDFAEIADMQISALEQILHSGCYEGKVSLLNVSSETHGHSIIISGRHIEEVPENVDSGDYCDNFLMWKIMNTSRTLWKTNQVHGFHSESFFWPEDYIGVDKSKEFMSLGVAPSAAEIAFGIERIIEWISSPKVNFLSIFVPATSTEVANYDLFFRETIQSANTFLEHLLRYGKNDEYLKSKVNFVIIGGINPHTSSMKSIVFEHTSTNVKIFQPYLSTSRVLEAWSLRSEDTEHLKDTSVYKVCSTATFRNLHPGLNTGIIPPFYLVAKPNQHFVVRHFEKAISASSHAFILTSGPSFKSHSCRENATDNVRLVDIYPLICWVLGLDKPFEHDGSLKRVQHLLRNSPSAQNLASFLEYASGRRSISSPATMTFNTMIFSILVCASAMLLAILFTTCAISSCCRRKHRTRRRKWRQGYSVLGVREDPNELKDSLLDSNLPDFGDENGLMVNQSANDSELVQMLHGPLESGRSRLALPEGVNPTRL